MDNSTFVYVTFIRTTPERLWSALTQPDFIQKYWFAMTIACDWKVGSPWRLVVPDGRVVARNEVGKDAASVTQVRFGPDGSGGAVVHPVSHALQMGRGIEAAPGPEVALEIGPGLAKVMESAGQFRPAIGSERLGEGCRAPGRFMEVHVQALGFP